MDPTDSKEEAWCAAQRANVERYLREQKLRHGRIAEVPAWLVYPNVSLWAIESARHQGKLGWWVVSGDLPTDYCSANGCGHPRQGMDVIAQAWLTQIDKTKPADTVIGNTGLSTEWIELMRSRAALMKEFAADDGLWQD